RAAAGKAGCRRPTPEEEEVLPAEERASSAGSGQQYRSPAPGPTQGEAERTTDVCGPYGSQLSCRERQRGRWSSFDNPAREQRTWTPRWIVLPRCERGHSECSHEGGCSDANLLLH